MNDYAIGDVQGCYDSLMRLLDALHFDEQRDRLWFVGDLVNRGPHSLEVLRFVKALPVTPNITLGNHDLHLLARLWGHTRKTNPDDTLDEVLKADDGEELGHWLRCQSFLVYEPSLNVVMCHAGIAPVWTLKKAIECAKALEAVLSGEGYVDFLNQMYGNTPNYWSDALTGMDRLRAMTNYFTRMRYCDAKGQLNLSYKGAPEHAPVDVYPWFEVPHRKPIRADIVFGHWAALEGRCSVPSIHALDRGCLWGGQLAALHLQTKTLYTVTSERPRKY